MEPATRQFLISIQETEVVATAVMAKVVAAEEPFVLLLDFLIMATGSVGNPPEENLNQAPVLFKTVPKRLQVTSVLTLGSYRGGTSPLDTSANIQILVSDGLTDNVDPRFLVALAVAETQAGTNMHWGPFNAWNMANHKPPKQAYTSWAQAIGDVAQNIANNYLGAGLTTTEAVYKKYEATKNYGLGLGNLNTALNQMQGNQSMLTDPCSSLSPRSPNQQ